MAPEPAVLYRRTTLAAVSTARKAPLTAGTRARCETSRKLSYVFPVHGSVRLKGLLRLVVTPHCAAGQ